MSHSAATPLTVRTVTDAGLDSRLGRLPYLPPPGRHGA